MPAVKNIMDQMGVNSSLAIGFKTSMQLLNRAGGMDKKRSTNNPTVHLESIIKSDT